MEESIKQMELEGILHLIKQDQADVECKLLDDQSKEGQRVREEALREGQWQLEDGDFLSMLLEALLSRPCGTEWKLLCCPEVPTPYNKPYNAPRTVTQGPFPRFPNLY